MLLFAMWAACILHNVAVYVLYNVGSNHSNPTEAWAASTQASNAAIDARNAATSVNPSSQQQQPAHSVHFQASSQLPYSFPQGVVINPPMAAAAANQRCLQTQGQVMYPQNAGAAPASYSTASRS